VNEIMYIDSTHYRFLQSRENGGQALVNGNAAAYSQHDLSSLQKIFNSMYSPCEKQTADEKVWSEIVKTRECVERWRRQTWKYSYKLATERCQKTKTTTIKDLVYNNHRRAKMF